MKAVAIYFSIVVGVLVLFGSLIFLMSTQHTDKYIGIGMVAAGLLYYISAKGLWANKEWGKKLAMITCGLIIVVGVLWILLYKDTNTLTGIVFVSIIIFIPNGSVLAYLLLKKKKSGTNNGSGG